MHHRVFRCSALLAGALLAAASDVEARPLPQPQPQTSDVQAVRAELDRVRAELDALRQEYRDRLDALQGRLTTLEAAASEPAAPPAVAAGAGPLPVYGNPNVSKIFNPDIAVVGNVLGAAGENLVAPAPALDMREIETSFQAVVDPYARADVFLAIGQEGVDIEEGYITFPTLPGGLVMKAGKMRNAFGKVNLLHTHVLPWTDRPLVTTNLLGGDEGLSGSGVSLAKLVPNPWIFLEATGEVTWGRTALHESYRRRDLTYVGHIRGYRDLTESSNVDLGGSYAYGRNDVSASDTTRLIGLDATFRYRPLRRQNRRLVARSELVWNRRSENAGATAFGAYLSSEYQLARRWFATARLDYAERAETPAVRDTATSWLVTFWPSEFSQLRGQYRRTRYADTTTANEVLFQVLFSIGTHGAHPF